MARFIDLFATFEIGAFRTIKNEQRQERRPHQSSTAEKECAQYGIFAFLAVFRMEEPYACVYAYPKTAKPPGISQKPFGEGQFGHGPRFRRRLQNLVVFQQTYLASTPSLTPQSPATPMSSARCNATT